MIQLSEPQLGAEEIEAVVAVLRSGWLVQGERVAAFEQAVAEYLEVPHVVAVSSGTAALHLALLTLDLRLGDEVLVPDFTFPATANAVELAGGQPVLVDVERATWNLDPALLERHLTERTRAIIPVHEFGCPAAMADILRFAGRHGLAVIEDAACALGTETDRGKAGTLGDAGCFSLHPRKALTTGEGGLISTRSADMAERLRLLRNHGMVRTSEKVDFVCAGLNYRMTDFQAALGLCQMRRLEGWVERRRNLAHRYDHLLKGHPFVLPSEPSGGRHVYQSYHILLPPTIDRTQVMDALHSQDIQSNYGANALHLLTHHRRFARGSAFPVAEEAYRQGLALPLHPGLQEAEIDRVVEALLRVGA